jgi:hypothetical protein
MKEYNKKETRKTNRRLRNELKRATERAKEYLENHYVIRSHNFKKQDIMI